MSARIYVASLSDYNAGRLHGVWIDLNQHADAEEVNSTIWEMLSKSPDPDAEEFAIHDYECFAGFKVEEYDTIESVFALHEVLEDLGDDCVPFALWAENVGYDAAEAVDNVDSFRDQFIGETTVKDYAYEYVNDCLFTDETPETLKTYFDYDAFARDLVLGGDVYELRSPAGQIYLFNNN